MNVTRLSPLCFLLACSSVGQKPVSKSYELTVVVESDPHRALAGAKVQRAGELLGTSAVDGRVAVRASGNEGERLDLDVVCPSGFRSPNAALTVTLRRASSRERPEYFVACPPLTRKLVVAARLEHGANLPIRYLGRELGRADAAGVAHLLLEAESENTVELTVDTSAQPDLRPKSPTARFRIGNSDDVVVLAQTFQSTTKPRPRVQRPTGPVRIR